MRKNESKTHNGMGDIKENGQTGKTMTGAERSNPKWRFPPRNGGIDFVTDPSSAHFSDAPITKLVRELIQNSLDAKDPGFRTPVTVEFTETNISRDESDGSATYIRMGNTRWIEDGKREGSETIIFELLNGPGYSVSGPAEFRIVIKD